VSILKNLSLLLTNWKDSKDRVFVYINKIAFVMDLLSEIN
jgi:hypothetical protein